MIAAFLPLILFIYYPSFSSGHGGAIERRTLVISLDAFRWDYLDRIRHLKGEQNSNIWRLVRNGAHAPEGVESAFTPMTFPNHWTMATGLYEESHGIIANSVYDPDLDRTFDLKNTTEKRLYGGEAIWSTLLKQTRKPSKDGVVGCVMWVGCQFGSFKNYVPYDVTVSWEKRIDYAIDWIEHDSAQLVLVYYHEPDATGHSFGPDSKEMNSTLLSIDEMIGTLLSKLEEKDLLDEINLLIVSDHGMTTILNTTPIVPHPLPENMFHVRVDGEVFLLVEPFRGQHNATVAFFKQFPHLSVIEKENIPDKWHYKHSRRVSPLLIMADLGYSFSGGKGGIHGYDNALKEMRPTFIAHGPAFISNSVVPPQMGTVDVYLLLCAILDLEPAANNGTATHFESFLHRAYLAEVETILHRTSFIALSVSVSVTVFALLLFTCYQLREATHKRNVSRGLGHSNGFLYRPLPMENVRPLLTTTTVGLDLDESDDERDGTQSKRP